MLFWILAAIMTAASAAALLVGKKTAVEVQRPEVALYKGQLAALEKSKKLGEVSEEDFRSSRAQIARQLLALQEPSEKPTAGFSKTLVAFIFAAPLAALPLYLWLGAPGLPSQPFATRPLHEVAFSGATSDAALAGLVADLESARATRPDDLELAVTLAEGYARQNRLEEAASLLRITIGRGADAGNLPLGTWSLLAQVLIAKDEGQVLQEARLALAQALEADPQDPRALYLTARALAQDGHMEGAVGLWLALVQSLPPGDPWASLADQDLRHLATLARQQGEGQPLDTEGLQGALDAESLASIAALSSQEQDAFIRARVADLATRLEAAPADPDGWMDLARAYLVLGELEAAESALLRAEAAIDTVPQSGPETGLESRLADLKEALSQARDRAP